MLFIPPQNIRNVSSSSTSSFQSLGTSSSWDSLQKSIDITLGSRPDEEIVTKKSIKPTTKVTKILGGTTRVMMVLGWTLVNQTVKMKTIAITKSLKNMKTRNL